MNELDFTDGVQSGITLEEIDALCKQSGFAPRPMKEGKRMDTMYVGFSKQMLKLAMLIYARALHDVDHGGCMDRNKLLRPVCKDYLPIGPKIENCSNCMHLAKCHKEPV